MSVPSKVPAFMDALIACLRAILTEDQVLDSRSTDATPFDCVLVGASDVDDPGWQTAAESAQSWSWLGHSQRSERATVHCVAIGYNGDAAMHAARASAYALLKIITDAIEADPSMGGSALWTVGVTSHVLRQIQDSDGATAQIPFDVEFEALT